MTYLKLTGKCGIMLNMNISDEKRIKYNIHQAEYRAKTNNASTHKYEKSVNGFLMRLYRNMTERVDGTQRKKKHLYYGKSILPKEEFYKYAKNSKEFNKMFKVWENSNYNRKLTPTIDRINVDLGYELDNMRWLTHSENSKLGTYHRNEIYGNPINLRWK